MYFQGVAQQGESVPNWTITEEQSASPTHAWSDSPHGNYPNNSDRWLISPTIDLSTTAGSTLYLYFNLKGDAASGDYLIIWCSGNGEGESLGYVTGQILDWTYYGASIPPACRSSDARIYFELLTDSNVTRDGYYLDDVSIYDGSSSKYYLNDDVETGQDGWSIGNGNEYYLGSITGSSAGKWERFHYPIDPSYDGSDIRIRFQLLSDDSVTDDGVYLDDIGVGPTQQHEGWAWASGTSMAAPHVTGAVGFLAGLYDESMAERKARILDHVDPRGLSVLTGGRLNLANTLVPPMDTDGDGVPDSTDNCILVSNANQRDTNNDGYGNLCDADLNNNGMVNTTDLGLFKAVFRQSGTNLDADFDGNGIVNTIDLGIFKRLFGKAPGPSGRVP